MTSYLKHRQTRSALDVKVILEMPLTVLDTRMAKTNHENTLVLKWKCRLVPYNVHQTTVVERNHGQTSDRIVHR